MAERLAIIGICAPAAYPSARRIHHIDTVFPGADPDFAVGQLQHRLHRRRAQGLLASGAVMEHADRLIGRIVTLQSAAIAANPDMSGLIQQHRANLGMSETGSD